MTDSRYTKEAIRARNHSLKSLEKHVPNPNFTVTELMTEVEKKRNQKRKDLVGLCQRILNKGFNKVKEMLKEYVLSKK